MKKIFSPLCLCAIILMVGSCKKSDDSAPSIIGEWEARTEVFKLSNASTNPPTVISSSTTQYAHGHGAYINLKADNTYFYKDSLTAPAASESGTYTFSSGQLITTPAGSSEGDTATIVLNSDNFVLSQVDGQGTLRADFSYTFFHP